VDSTNNYAMGLLHAGMARHGTAVFTHEQTKGRGQRNKAWVSAARNNIALSLIIEPTGMNLSQAFLLSKTVATATRHFFNDYTMGGVRIKWPNDIYWNDRKAGGMLIENVIQGSQWKWSIVGIGVNINQTAFDALTGKAVSLKQITGKHFDPLCLAKELCDYVETAFQRIHEDAAGITDDYHRHLYKRDEKIKLKRGPAVFDAIVKEVNDAGQLVAVHTVEEKFAVGEIEWIV
jgi:BirA family transcriptional regulator, biotin operon repressor / biotin---[acetyl-CoA-carboxylase] ligase